MVDFCFPSSDSLSEKAKLEDNEVSIIEMNSKLETALTAKQESEAKVSTMEEKIKVYESELSSLKEKVCVAFCIILSFIFDKLVIFLKISMKINLGLKR